MEHYITVYTPDLKKCWTQLEQQYSSKFADQNVGLDRYIFVRSWNSAELVYVEGNCVNLALCDTDEDGLPTGGMGHYRTMSQFITELNDKNKLHQFDVDVKNLIDFD